MSASAMNRLEIKIVHLPSWCVPLAAAASVALIALAGFIGFGVLLLMSPIILAAGVIHLLRRPQSLEPVQRPWPERTHRSNAPQETRSVEPVVIDGEYEVVEERNPPSPDRGRAGDRQRRSYARS